MCLGLFLGHASSADAADYTAHGFNPNDFCAVQNISNGAEKMMSDLNFENKAKFDEISKYEKEIADLVKSNKLITDIRDIKNRYLYSLAEIAKEGTSLVDNIGYIRSAGSDGAVLGGVHSTPADSAASTSQTIDAIKKFLEIKNSFTPILSQNTQSKIDEVLGQVPSEISPDNIKAIMGSKAPTISKLLESISSVDEVTNCFDNKPIEACSKIGIDNVSGIEILKKEMQSLSQHLRSLQAIKNIPTHLSNTNEQVNADAFRKEQFDKLQALKAKVQNIANEDNFKDIEYLKKYIAEKYMCSCNKTGTKSLTITKQSQSACTSDFVTVSTIAGLSDQTSSIASALYAQEINLPMDGESCDLAPDKLKPYTETCRAENTSIPLKFAPLCKRITDEYKVKVENEKLLVRQNAKWEKFNRENYVKYDASAPDEYTAVKKKSNWRIAGEGISPILPSFIPIWLGNEQMRNNISALTNQAMFQKQYLHNVDYYNQSPWLYNFNYFGYGNPFMPGSTLNSSSVPGGSTTGFNFGQ